MKGILNTLRWILAIVLCLILFIVSVLTPPLLTLSTIITNRENIKEIVLNSDIYVKAPQLVLDIAEEKIKSEEVEDKVDIIGDKNMDKVIKETLTPTFVEGFFNGAIDGIYNYLEGKADTLQIDFDKTLIEDALLSTLLATSDAPITSIEELKKLPTCTDKQLAKLEKNGFESLEDACIPEDVDFNKLTEQAINGFGGTTKSGDSDSVVNFIPEDLNTNLEGGFPARQVFKLLTFLPLIIVSISILLVLLIVLLIPDHLKGLTIVSVIGLVPSVIHLILSLLLLLSNFLTPLLISLIKTSITPINIDLSIIESMIVSIQRMVSVRYLIISAILIAFYTSLLLLKSIIKKRSTTVHTPSQVQKP